MTPERIALFKVAAAAGEDTQALLAEWLAADAAAAEQTFALTTFKDKKATAGTVTYLDWAGLKAYYANPPKARTKHHALLVKGGLFPDNSRANIKDDEGNVIGQREPLNCTFLQGDIDGRSGQLSAEEAVARAEQHGLKVIVHNSASHTPEAPRLRVVAPMSKPITDKAEHHRLMSVLNGAMGGVVDSESWDWSRGYFTARVEMREVKDASGNTVKDAPLLPAAPYECFAVEGEFIDKLQGIEPIESKTPVTVSKPSSGSRGVRGKPVAMNPVTQFLYDNDWVKRTDGDAFHVYCPWSLSRQTGDAGEHGCHEDGDDSSSTWFQADEVPGVYGNFVDLHRCKDIPERNTEAFLRATGAWAVVEKLAEEAREATREEFDVVESSADEDLAGAAAAARNAKKPAAVFLETDEERKERREREKALAAGGDHMLVPRQRKMAGSEMLTELAFITEGSRVAFIDQPRDVLPFDEFKRAFAASKEVAANAAGKQTVKHRADLWLENLDRKTVTTTTFAPGRGAFCANPDGVNALNRWRDYTEAPPANWAELAQPLLDHIAYLVPVPEERERFLDWVAHIAQHPGELPSTHYLMVAKETGIGRNLLAYALARAFAGYTALGFDLGEALRSGFNGALGEKVFVVVDELKEGGPQQGAGRTGEKLKSMLTEVTRTVNPKYGRQRVEFNAARFLMLSNHVSALPLADSDRRVIVIENPTQHRDASYYRRLYQLLDAPGFGAAVREALRRRDISGFNPGEKAPRNDVKNRVIRASRSEVEEAVRDIAGQWPSDCITASRLQLEVQGSFNSKVSIAGPATEAGFVSRRARNADGKRLSVWIVRDHKRWLCARESEVCAEFERGEQIEGSYDVYFPNEEALA
jgi:hypothetical protein